jgi:hypothetical protein
MALMNVYLQIHATLISKLGLQLSCGVAYSGYSMDFGAALYSPAPSAEAYV